MDSGELIYCNKCKETKPKKDFKDPSLKKGIGRICMKCKKKPRRRGKWKNITIEIEVPETLLTNNGKIGKSPTQTKIPSSIPSCPRCGSKMVKRWRALLVDTRIYF